MNNNFYRIVWLVLGLVLGRTGSAEAMEPKLRWLGHAAFEFTTRNGKVFLIDPWLTNPKAPKDAEPKRVDAILLTHGHVDHVGQAFELAAKFNAPVVACYELTEIAKRKGVKNVLPLNPSGSARVDDVTITAVQSIHSSSYQEGENNLYAGIALGFVVAEDGVPAFYHAGDTGVFSDMAMIPELYSPTVAILPVGGIYTMKPAEAAIAVRNLQVRTVIPIHYGTFPALTGTPEELSKELKRRGIPTVVFPLKPGQSVTLKELAAAR